MQRILRTGTAAAAVVVGVIACGATCPAMATEAANEIIVRFEAGVNAAERAAIRRQTGTALERALPIGGMQLLDVAPDRSALAAERALEREGGVLYAEPNVARRLFLRPNDPLFPQLWGMENTGQIIGTPGIPDADTDAADAWDVAVGAGVVVAVVDSGMDGAHPDLAPNAWRNPGESGSARESNRVDDDGNGFIDDWRGWDFVGRGDSNPSDPNGHGTHVAGTIGARRGNALGVAGVADNSPLMPLRVFDAGGSGTIDDAISAYVYAALEGAKVMNLSFGSPQASLAERDAIAALPGVLFVAAAGNGEPDGIGDDNDGAPVYPCAYPLPNLVCVAASDNRDRLAGFSNFGARSVDLAAPGVDIFSTVPGGVYDWLDGTSMAAPHVSGAAALLWGTTPSASASAIGSALLAGTDTLPGFSGRTVTGGRLNVLNSLRALLDSGPASTAQPAPPLPQSPPAQLLAVRDRVPPRLSVRVARRKRLGALLRRGLAVRLRCFEACSARLRLRVRGRVIARAGPRSILAGASRRVVLRVPVAGRARLRAAAPTRVTLVVRATDGSGNARAVTARVLLRR
jgi:subtilisin family serine protease